MGMIEKIEVERKLLCAFSSDFKQRLSFLSEVHNWSNFSRKLLGLEKWEAGTIDQNVDNVFFPRIRIQIAPESQENKLLQEDVLKILSKKRKQLLTEILVLQQVVQPESELPVHQFQCKIVGKLIKRLLKQISPFSSETKDQSAYLISYLFKTNSQNRSFDLSLGQSPSSSSLPPILMTVARINRLIAMGDDLQSQINRKSII